MSRFPRPAWERRRERLIPPLSPLPAALVALLAAVHGSSLLRLDGISLGSLYTLASVLLRWERPSDFSETDRRQRAS